MARYSLCWFGVQLISLMSIFSLRTLYIKLSRPLEKYRHLCNYIIMNEIRKSTNILTLYKTIYSLANSGVWMFNLGPIFSLCFILHWGIPAFRAKIRFQILVLFICVPARSIPYLNLLLLRGRHQRHRPAHKSRNLARVVWLILSVQYQQKPSADTVESQYTAWCRPRSNNKPFNVGEFVLYEI